MKTLKRLNDWTERSPCAAVLAVAVICAVGIATVLISGVFDDFRSGFTCGVLVTLTGCAGAYLIEKGKL